ncbi:MAG TPA: DUF4097 family beta strand repeat-containing protein [Opitutaceae bacterium]
MKKTIHYSLVLAAAAALSAGRALADESASTIAFSDPSKPGVLKVHILHGDVSVTGGDVKEITVETDAANTSPTPRKDGLRVLSSNSGFQLAEKGNIATLEYGADSWAGGSTNFSITVPRSTTVMVANSSHGDVECSGIDGDIDVRTMSGDIELKDVAAGAVVETMNGEIKVDVKALRDAHPLSFTSMHGEISLHVPESAKADVIFRTHRGVILTNFDDKALVTRTEITPSRRTDHKQKDKDRNLSDMAAAPAPVAPVPAVAPAAPASPSSHSDSDDDWRADVRESVREAAREAADASREAAEAIREGLDEAHMEVSGITAPMPPMTGGKVVSGKLNGGGVQIQAATLTGDIILRKSE